MWRRCLAILVLASALAGGLAAQESKEEKDRWKAAKEKGLSLLIPKLEKVESHLEEILADLKKVYLPAAEEAGYEVSEVRVSVGMQTAVTLALKHAESVDEGKRKELLDNYRDNSIATKMLEALFATDEVDFEGYEANEIHLSLGLPTSTTLVFTPAEDAASGS